MESYALEKDLEDIKKQLQKLRGEIYGIATLIAAVGIELDGAVKLARVSLGQKESPHSEPALSILQTLEEMRKEINPQMAEALLLQKPREP